MRRPRLTLVVGLLLLFLAASGSLATAHGIGKPQVINVENGPYLLSVWTDPDPLRIDQTHIVVAVMDPDTRAPLVENIDLSIRMEIPGDPDSAIIASAESDNSVSQLLYVVQFNDLPSAGQWEATVMVDGRRGFADEVSFPLEVTLTPLVNWVKIGIGGLVAVAVSWLALAMLQASNYSTPKSSAARRKVMSGR